jgi:hypothetical protein
MLNQPPLALLAMQPPLPEPVDLPPPPRPALPPLPLPADPDTLTGWLTLPANKLTEADAIQRLCGVAQRYEDLSNDPDAAAIQSLVSECMTGADELTCFVTMVGSPDIAPYVVLVHCLNPYTAGFGTTSQFQGKTFCFLEECVGIQPPLVKEPADGLGGTVSFTNVAVPTPAEVHAHYGNQEANTLMTTPAVPTEKSFPKLLFMPNHWAPYFMAAQTPYQAFCI